GAARSRDRAPPSPCPRARCGAPRSRGSGPARVGAPRAGHTPARGAAGQGASRSPRGGGPLMFVVPLIERKRDGGALTPEEWSALVAAYTAGRVPDYQMSALLMAVYFRGLERPELAAPADGKLYALRDVTGTVEAIPLIAASIMSKKLAEGLTGLVIDVKRGGGAFLPALKDGLELARTMIALGEDRGCPTVALLTAMDRPLGRACGNALETEEAILALRGEGPADLMEVTYALGVEMLLAAGVEKTSKKARQRLENALGSGLAAETFERVIEAQGGNPKVVEDASVLPQAQEVEVYNAPRTGVVQRVEPKIVGRAVVAMGGGGLAVDDAVGPTVGFVITVKPGDKVPSGEPIASVFAKDPAGIKLGFEALQQA